MSRLKGKALGAQDIKPMLRAYGLGYLALTTPRLLGWFSFLFKKDVQHRQKLQQLIRILLNGWGLNRFPTACAVLVGGATWLPLLFLQISSTCSKWIAGKSLQSSQKAVRLVRFLSAFVSALLVFRLLNKKPSGHAVIADTTVMNGERSGNRTNDADGRVAQKRAELAGKTLDLTLFALTRAVSVVVHAAWNEWRRRRKSQGTWSHMAEMVPRLADAGVFAGSAAVVMWAWFYSPERLPQSYEKWIGEAAQVDKRLIEALRRARRGEFVYGKDTGQAPLLTSMCKDYGWPTVWGDPAITAPIPCEMVHMGCGPSCEWHAVSRFMGAFKFALMTYLPLQLLLRIRSRQATTAVTRAVKDAMRSSSFLALFISIFYYSVCLARTRLGPKILDSKTVTPIMWDSGLCVGAGCLMCGWSILVESPSKRQEIAFFVAPRAAATLLPRRYDRKYLLREQAAFAMSAAIILTCAQEQPELIRGVFGRVLSSVIG